MIRNLALTCMTTIMVVFSGCSTRDEVGIVSVGAPADEECPAKFDMCVELCRPRGVRQFSCASPMPGIAFECECLDGYRPLEDEPRDDEDPPDDRTPELPSSRPADVNG